VHALARIASEERRVDEGIELYRQALHLYEELGNRLEALNVRAHLGCEYLTRGTVREGMRILTETLEEPRRPATGAAWLTPTACWPSATSIVETICA
jgi:hypothetical protein